MYRYIRNYTLYYHSDTDILDYWAGPTYHHYPPLSRVSRRTPESLQFMMLVDTTTTPSDWDAEYFNIRWSFCQSDFEEAVFGIEDMVHQINSRRHIVRLLRPDPKYEYAIESWGYTVRRCVERLNDYADNNTMHIGLEHTLLNTREMSRKLAAGLIDGIGEYRLAHELTHWRLSAEWVLWTQFATSEIQRAFISQHISVTSIVDIITLYVTDIPAVTGWRTHQFQFPSTISEFVGMNPVITR